MTDLRIYNRKTLAVVTNLENVSEYTIRKTGAWWRIDIDYYDEDADEILSDSMLLCEAHSDHWEDDLLIQKVSYEEKCRQRARMKLASLFTDWLITDCEDYFSTYCEEHYDDYDASSPPEVNDEIGKYLSTIQTSFINQWTDPEYIDII